LPDSLDTSGWQNGRDFGQKLMFKVKKSPLFLKIMSIFYLKKNLSKKYIINKVKKMKKNLKRFHQNLFISPKDSSKRKVRAPQGSKFCCETIGTKRRLIG
jgi:hypothetical protein